jgi:hypothetical protein
MTISFASVSFNLKNLLFVPPKHIDAMANLPDNSWSATFKKRLSIAKRLSSLNDVITARNKKINYPLLEAI